MALPCIGLARGAFDTLQAQPTSGDGKVPTLLMKAIETLIKTYPAALIGVAIVFIGAIGMSGKSFEEVISLKYSTDLITLLFVFAGLILICSSIYRLIEDNQRLAENNKKLAALVSDNEIQNETKKKSLTTFVAEKERTLAICADHIRKFQSYLTFLAKVERVGSVTDQDLKEIEHIIQEVGGHYDNEVVPDRLMSRGFAPATHETYDLACKLCDDLKHLAGKSEDDVRNTMYGYRKRFRHKLDELHTETVKIASKLEPF